MRWLNYFVLLLILLLTVSVPLAKDLHPLGTGSLEGIVVDERGAPIAHASVEATNIFRGGANAVSSDLNGSYRIAELAPGTYSIWAQAKGYSSEWIPRVVIEEGKVTQAVLQLTRERRPTT